MRQVPGLDWSAFPLPAAARTDEASQVPWRSIPQLCNSPATPVGTPIAACPVQPPLSQRRRRQHCEFRGSIALLRCPLCTLHDLRCRMQHSLPAGGLCLCGSSARWTASKSFRHIIMTSSLPELRLALCGAADARRLRPAGRRRGPQDGLLQRKLCPLRPLPRRPAPPRPRRWRTRRVRLRRHASGQHRQRTGCTWPSSGYCASDEPKPSTKPHHPDLEEV